MSKSHHKKIFKNEMRGTFKEKKSLTIGEKIDFLKV